MTSPNPSAQSGNDTPIWLPLRLWLAAEIFFAFVASLATFLNPKDAATNFAWPIPVTVMAAVLGVFYASSLPVTIWSVTMKRWQDVRTVAVSLGIFAAFMTLMTYLHFDKFSVGTAPYWVWIISYIGPPPLFAYFYYHHQKRSAPVGTGITDPLPPGMRSYLRYNGILLIALALGIFAMPALLVANAPWTLTPLTARTLANMLLAAGIAQFWMALEGDWRRGRLAGLLLILVAPLFVIQLVRYPDGVNFANPFLLFVLIDSTLTAILLLRVWLTVGRRS